MFVLYQLSYQLRLVQLWHEAGVTSGPYQADTSMRLYLMSLLGRYQYKAGQFFDTTTSTGLYTRVLAWYLPTTG